MLRLYPRCISHNPDHPSFCSLNAAECEALRETTLAINVPINKTLDKALGGVMVIPLLFGTMFHTVASGTGEFFGSFTGALFTGALPLIAAFFPCLGTTIEFKATSYIVKKGGSLLFAKVGAAWAQYLK